MLKKSILIFLSVLFLCISIKPGDVYADNDDPATPICTIAINGRQAGLTAGEAPEVPAFSSTVGSELGLSATFLTWPVTVTLNQAAQQRFAACNGGHLRVAVQENLFSWKKSFLSTTDGNSFSGEFSMIKRSALAAAGPRIIDVEVSNAHGACKEGDPICRRVYADLNGEMVENSNMSCTSEGDQFAAAMNQSPSSLVVGQASTISVPFTDNFISACGLYYAAYQIRRNGAEEIAKGDLMHTSKPLTDTVSFTPDSVGQYVLTITIHNAGGCSNVDCGFNGTALRTFTKNFCVSATPDQPCTPEAVNGEGPTITTFSICRQIPVMTQQQIDGMVSRLTDPQVAAKARTEMESRATQQRQEKVRCCLCTFGTSSWNPQTGACSGEDGTDIVRQRANFKPGLYTAVGCIGIDQESIITQLVRIGLGIAGGVALLMILAGAFMLSTSQGEPKVAGEAKELITSAVIGLLFIIFSVTILQFIGVTILHIPGFGGSTATSG